MAGACSYLWFINWPVQPVRGLYEPQIEVHFQGEFRVGDRGVEVTS